MDIKRNGGLSAFLTLIFFASGASGQDADASAEPLEEIVVTATRRGATSVQDTPLSITALSGESLVESNARDLGDYFRLVPSMSINNKGPGEEQIIIRGVYSVGAGTVGLYFDDIVITGESGSSPIVKLFDIDRIEVLRGPQGTTFGSSSLSGTLRWIPNYPAYDAIEAEVGTRVAGTRHSDDFGWELDGMFNVPIIEDKLAFRLSGALLRRNGYIDNRFEDDANDENSEAVRAMLSWRASEELEVHLMTMYQNVAAGTRHYYHEEDLDLPFSPSLDGGPLPTQYYSFVRARGGTDDKLSLSSLKANYTFDWGQIEAIATLSNRHSDFRHPVSAAGEILSGGLYPADNGGQSVLRPIREREITTTELRFVSDWNSPFNIIVGGFSEKVDADLLHNTFAQVEPITGEVQPDTEIFLDRSGFADNEQLAFYGELYWDISDRLSATFGARAFEFDYEQQDTALVGFFGAPAGGPGPFLTFDESGTTFKAGLSYNVTADFMAYGSVTEGFRPGGAQNPIRFGGLITVPAGFESDEVTNYEIGAKNSWWNNQLIARAALFNIDWSNMQTEQDIVDPGTGLRTVFLGNAGESLVRGAEVEVIGYPVEALELKIGLTYLSDAQLEEDLPLPEDGQEGDWMPYVPELTASLQGNYEFPLPIGADLVGFIRGDWSYVGETRETFRPTDLFYREIDSYSILNLRFGVESEKWEAWLSLENLLDEDEIIAYTVDFAGPRPVGGNIPDSLYRPWPRTFSLSIRRSFDIL